jgi:acyl-coenzyme A thioesterase PaaI-like protein
MVNFRAAAEGERLVARGSVVKPGRTLTVTSVEAFCVQGRVERLCAVMLQTLIRVPLGADVA